MYFITATLAFLAYTGLTSAASTCQKIPSSDNPSANTLAIYTPSQNQIVPVDRPFTITWDPTTGINTVSIVLLKGPSTNVVPLSCIVNSAPNTGNFIWTPSSSLTPTGNSGYGLQIIDDTSGKFQYSTQFGISNPDVASSSSSSTAPATQLSDGQVQIPTGSGTLTATSHHTAHTTTHTKSQYAISSSTSSKASHHHTTSSLLIIAPSSGFPSHTKNSTKSSTTHHSAKTPHVGTGSGAKNSTHFVTPTGSMTKPSSLGPVTSVVVAQTASTPVEVANSATSPATASKSAAAVRVVAGGMVAGLGGLAVVFL